MIADTMLPAAPVTTNTVSVGGQRGGSRASRSRCEQADRPAQPVGVADLDGARIAQGLFDRRVGERRGLAAGLEVDGLDERVGRARGRAPCVKPRDRAAHDATSHRVVVAVAAAQAGGG